MMQKDLVVGAVGDAIAAVCMENNKIVALVAREGGIKWMLITLDDDQEIGYVEVLEKEGMVRVQIHEAYGISFPIGEEDPEGIVAATELFLGYGLAEAERRN